MNWTSCMHTQEICVNIGLITARSMHPLHIVCITFLKKLWVLLLKKNIGTWSIPSVWSCIPVFEFLCSHSLGGQDGKKGLYKSYAAASQWLGQSKKHMDEPSESCPLSRARRLPWNQHPLSCLAPFQNQQYDMIDPWVKDAGTPQPAFGYLLQRLFQLTCPPVCTGPLYTFQAKSRSHLLLGSHCLNWFMTCVHKTDIKKLDSL